MKFSILSILTIASTVSADYMWTRSRCGDAGNCSNVQGTWNTDTKLWYLDHTQGGCYKFPPVSGMTQLCIDWGRARGHFYFVDQPKRCIKKGEDSDCSKDAEKFTCATWNEVPCTW